MKSLLLICLFIASGISLLSQEPSIHNQNFCGVKSVNFYVTETDSIGTVLKRKQLIEQHFFDTAGKKTRTLYYENGIMVSSKDWIYDSLARLSMRIDWTKKDGNRKYIQNYSTDSTGRFTIRKVYYRKEVQLVESSYWDTLSKTLYVSTWDDSLTLGPPGKQQRYDRNHKLIMTSSYNGFTEYRYDSLGTLNYMLIRQFEDGHCSAYMPFEYECIYSEGKLVKYRTRWNTTYFTYNEKHLVTTQKQQTNSENRLVITEAEYIYY